MILTNNTKAARMTLRPIHTFHVDNILKSWKDLNEVDEPNEDWRLVAYPFLADGSIALLFEFQKINLLYPVGISSFYKVLVYDPRNGELLKQHRFRLQDGFCCTVFFREGNLFGVVRSRAAEDYNVIKLWPEKCDKDQFNIGKHITQFVSDREGNIYVGYECTKQAEDGTVTPVICYAEHDGWRIRISSRFPVIRCQDLALDAENRFWYHLYPDNRLICLGTGYPVAYSVEISGFTGFGFSQSGDRLLVEYDYQDDNGCRLFAMRREKTAYVKPIPVSIESIGEFLPGRGSLLGTKAAYYCGGKLYVVDLNELER